MQKGPPAFFSYIVYMDENGDAEGNYTLIARNKLKGNEQEYGLFPVGVFSLRRTDSRLPVSINILFIFVIYIYTILYIRYFKISRDHIKYISKIWSWLAYGLKLFYTFLLFTYLLV